MRLRAAPGSLDIRSACYSSPSPLYLFHSRPDVWGPRLLLAFAISALAVSVATWIHASALAAAIYLWYFPGGVALPLLVLGAPLRLLSAPPHVSRRYAWGATTLGGGLVGGWSAAALLDPTAASALTHTSLLVGWMAGGLIYEVLLLYLFGHAEDARPSRPAKRDKSPRWASLP